MSASPLSVLRRTEATAIWFTIFRFVFVAEIESYGIQFGFVSAFDVVNEGFFVFGL